MTFRRKVKRILLLSRPTLISYFFNFFLALPQRKITENVLTLAYPSICLSVRNSRLVEEILIKFGIGGFD
jgi:hypothetical protein